MLTAIMYIVDSDMVISLTPGESVKFRLVPFVAVNSRLQSLIACNESRRILPVYDGFFCSSLLATSIGSNTPGAIVYTVTIGICAFFVSLFDY